MCSDEKWSHRARINSKEGKTGCTIKTGWENISQKFWDAAIYDVHPLTGEPTLEFKVNYVPILGGVRKTVMEFAISHNLTERFVIVDANGKQVE